MRNLVTCKRNFFILLAAVMMVSTACKASKSNEYEHADKYMVAETAAAMGAAPSAVNTSMVFEEAAAEDFKLESGYDAGSSSLTSSSTIIEQTPMVNRKLIRRVDMNVETDRFDTLLSDLQKQVAAMSGYIESSDVSGSSIRNNRPINRYANLTVRIPSTDLDSFIRYVETNGNITYKSENTEDVTLQYSDLESRKKTLSVEQDRIWALLEKADTLEAVIALEERLSEIRYELESMESQLRLYDNQVDFSCVDIHIEEVTLYTPTEPESVLSRIERGLTRNVEEMCDFAVSLFVGIIVSIPFWLPMGLILFVFLLLIRKIAKRRREQFGNTISRQKKSHSFKLPFIKGKNTEKKEMGSDEDKKEIK